MKIIKNLSELLHKKKEKELMNKHPYPWPINLPTNKLPIKRRIEGMEKVIDLYENRWDSIYKPRLRTLKNKFHDRKRCFVIGNGPSLNDTDLSKLKNEITFGTNSIFLKFKDTPFRPTFYIVEDHLVAEDRSRQINALQGFTRLIPIYLSYCLDESMDTIFFNHCPRKSYPRGFDFSTNAGEVTYAGCTVTFTCMQFAFYMGFKEIYLIGMDFSYSIPPSATTAKAYNVGILDMKEDDPNHFNKDYFGKGYRWHEPQVEKMGEAYKEAKRVTELHGCKIFNATKGGKLEIFERVDYDSLFHQNGVAAANPIINKNAK